MLAVCVGGCGSTSPRTTAADARVESGSCQSAGAGGRVISESCSFVLSDGQRFRCHSAFAGHTLTAPMLEHTKGCVRLRSLAFSAGVRRMIATLDRTRSCLAGKGLRALGGPVLPPNPSGSSSADGELVVGRGAAHVIFIALYTSTARAQQLQPGLVQNARRLNGRVERHGAVSVLSIRPPSGLRAAVQACVAG